MPEQLQPEFKNNIESILTDYLKGKISEENLKNALRSNFNFNEESIEEIVSKAKLSKSRREFIKGAIATIIGSILGTVATKKIQDKKEDFITTPIPEQVLTPGFTPTSEPTTTPTPEKISTPTPEAKKIKTKVIYRGPAGTKKVAVTFDDSPSPVFLTQLLEFAKTNGVKFVWFTIGKTTSKEAAEIIKEGLDSGLIRIGNHTMNHRIDLFASLSNLLQIKNEIELWIETMLNYGLPENELLRYFRPPGGGGGYNGGDPDLISILEEIGYSYLCMWDVEFIYTTRVNNLEYNVSNIYSIMTNNIYRTQGGNLVLCHFNNTDVSASTQAINYLLKQGYTFVFPEELFD